LLAVPLLGFTLGVVFAWLAREDVARGAPGALGSRSLAVVCIYALVAFTPACACLFVLEPDWAGAYLFDGGRARLLQAATMLATLASVPIGFVAAARATRARRPSRVLRLGMAAGLSGLALTLALFPRLSVRATYAQYHGDFGTEPVLGSPLGWTLAWVFAVLGLASAYTAQALRRLQG
jgi:hypothetical protein